MRSQQIYKASAISILQHGYNYSLAKNLFTQIPKYDNRKVTNTR